MAVNVLVPFVDAVGIALRVLEDLKTWAEHWFKVWVKDFRTVPKEQASYQHPITFNNGTLA